MKILYLVKSFAARAGVERVISDKVNWLSERGYDVTLVTYEQGNHPFSFKLNNSVRCFDLNTRFFELSHFSLIRRLFHYFVLRCQFKKRFKSIVADVSPDVIIVTTYSIQLFKAVLEVKNTSKLLIESHVALNKIKHSEAFHNNIVMLWCVNQYVNFLLNKVKLFDGVIALTNGDAESWRLLIDKVSVIPNPITCFPNSVANVNEIHRIICVGRLHEQKGFDLLIRAFSLISDKSSDWKIDIYGEGSEKQYLLDLIKVCNLDEKITINPTTGNIFNEYMNSGFLVLSSRYEGFGLVLVEAMSCGLPCVSMDCQYGPNEIIRNGENGFLVEDGNVNMLADKMLCLIRNDGLRLKMGAKAKQSITLYQKDVVMQKWINLFDSL